MRGPRKDLSIKSTIKLTGIKAEGKHGANPGEQDTGQTFVIDVKIKLDVGSDELDQTVDYEDLINMVKSRVETSSYKLIETLAYNIASDIDKIDKVDKVSVSVHKPMAADSLGVDNITAKVKLKKDNS